MRMVAEGGGYRAASMSSSRVGYSSSTNRSAGNYGSPHPSYAAADNTSYSATGGGSSAPVFGRIRVTQSMEREGKGRDVAGNLYAGTQGLTPMHTATAHGRRYSLSTDRIWSKDRSLDPSSVGGSRSSLQSVPFYGSARRASLASSTQKYHTLPLKQHHYARDGSGKTDLVNMNGSESNSFPDHHYGSTSFKRSTRASSVFSYDGQSAAARETSISRYEVLRGRSPSVSKYETQNAYGRAPSVARYESRASLGRSPSVSRYETPSSATSSSASRYEAQNSLPRSSFVRASSVSRYESGSTSLGRRFRSASVSRYEVPSSFGATEVDYPRARSVSRSEQLYENTSSTPVNSSAADDDSAYELRRQLRALRNQQIRAGSVTHHERQEHVSHTNQEPPHVIRPRSWSTSSPMHRDGHRRYKVITLHSPVQVESPSNPPIITGYPEPTLYSAKIFRTLPSAQDAQVNIADNIAVSDTELGFIDNREDITSYVIKPGEKFLPTDVSVNVLPSGKKAVTYTRFSQKGHGDQQAANDEIERIIRKTKHLQESMHTLEDFVKRNRSLFPEDIIIYQNIIFYLLSEAELIKMGERPDAEIYGVKIRERLVAPVGTDVASILKRFYSRHKEVDVEYEHPEVIRQQLKRTEAAGGDFIIPHKSKRFDDDFDLERSRNVPHDWAPTRRSRSIDHDALYIDEDVSGRTQKVQRHSVPEFTHRLRRQRAAVGQAVRLSCSVSAFPEAIVTWYRGKQEIIENGRFVTKNISGLCTLTISDIAAEDAVVYTARAVNREGEATTSALLEVYDLRADSAERQAPRKQPSSEPLGVAAGAVAVGRRPFFLLEARNLWADVGERAVFEVQAAGKPLPSFTWIRDEDQVIEDDRIQILSDGYGNCKLTIKEIKGTDFGTYRCLAQNDDGTVESIAALFCVGNESVRPGQTLKDELRSSAGQHKGRKPKFVNLPLSRIDVREGESLTLQCAVDGDPKPHVTWYKGVRELTYTGRHRVLEERNNCYVMQIKSTLATDSGEYTVTAHNLCGLVEFIVCVNVLPGKQSIEDLDVNWKRPDITPLEYELVTKTRQGKMPPIFVKKLPREKQMKAGTSLKLDCYIEESKPREYLVDVDVIVKNNKKEEADKLNLLMDGDVLPQRTIFRPESNVETLTTSAAEVLKLDSEHKISTVAAAAESEEEGTNSEPMKVEEADGSLPCSEDFTAFSNDEKKTTDVKEQPTAISKEDENADHLPSEKQLEVDETPTETAEEPPVEKKESPPSDRKVEDLDSSITKPEDLETIGQIAINAAGAENAERKEEGEEGEEEDSVSSSGSKLSSSESEDER